jgi:ATP-binding cassette subfamily F protein uup
MDDGLLQYQQGLRIAYVPQEPIFEAEETVFEAVSKGVAEAKALREEYEALSVGESGMMPLIIVWMRFNPSSKR